MIRRSTAEAIYVARRIATAARLGSSGVSPDTVEVWLKAWEAYAEANRLEPSSSDFWVEGEAWINGERAVQRLPQ